MADSQKESRSMIKVQLKHKGKTEFILEVVGNEDAVKKTCRQLPRIISRVLNTCHGRSKKATKIVENIIAFCKLIISLVGLFRHNYFARISYGFCI